MLYTHIEPAPNRSAPFKERFNRQMGTERTGKEKRVSLSKRQHGKTKKSKPEKKCEISEGVDEAEKRKRDESEREWVGKA